MRKFDGKVYRDMTPEEIAEMNAGAERFEREYWASIPYDEAVQNEIHKKYTLDQEIALLRQQKEKPIEYAEYFVYCEQCKDFVK
jgi:hypothetical protein